MPKASTVTFFCVLVTFAACLGWTIATRRSLATAIETLRHELVELNVISNRRKAKAEESSQDRAVLMRVFNHSTHADEVPNLGGHRIVSNQRNSDAVAFYVPDGKHTLIVKTSWEPLQPGASQPVSSNAVSPERTPSIQTPSAGEQTWSCPLMEQCGYFFSVTGGSPRNSSIGWELASNHPAFPVRKENLPLSPFRGNGASWRSCRNCVFPNERNVHVIGKDKAPRNAPQPLRIGDWERRGRTGVSDDQRGPADLRVRFELTLLSHNPPVLSATRLQTLRDPTAVDRFTSMYLGDGRYTVKTNPVEASD
jgi:hypothetical protein